MDIKVSFGKAIKEYRKKKGISQEELADLCGLHRTYISDVERGARNVSLVNIEKICEALEVKVYRVFRTIDM